MTTTTTANDISNLVELQRNLDRSIRNNGRRLRALAQRLGVASGSVCPDCNSRDTEDNGASEYRCSACDHRWGTESGEQYGF